MRFLILLLFSMILSSGFLLAQEEADAIKDTIKTDEQLPALKTLHDEVVTGYYSQNKTGITGSVSVVEPSMLTAIPAGNVNNLLQGRASGVNIIGSGQPGEASRVRIRGFSSFLDNDPLYVVDGLPTRDISYLNPNDVAELTVLKDAGAASVYGSRASNGVIVITIRRGDKGFNVTYDMSAGIQLPGKGTKNDVLNAKEYSDLQWLVYDNDSTVEMHPVYGPSSNPNPTIPIWAANTDWYDAITDPALIMNHHLNLSGGSEKVKYYAGFGAFRQDGILLFTHNTRYTARVNSEMSFYKNRIKAGENINLSFQDKLCVPNLNENSPIQLGPYRSQSIIPVRWTGPDFTGMSHTFTEGDWGGTGITPGLGNAPNVVADLTRNKDDYFRDLRLTGSVYLDAVIMEGLNFMSTLEGTWDKGSLSDYTYPTYKRSNNIPDTTLVESRAYNSDWIWTNSLVFNRQLGQHKITAILGYEAVNYNIGRVESNVDSTEYTPTRLLSTLIKADYLFRDRYLLSATLRRDGCSRFSESNRYGIFPSFSAGWHISNESFLSGLKWISDLKIRGSWGIMGNQFAISPQNAVYLFGESVGGSWYDLYGTFNSSVMGYYPVKIGNPDATWETITVTDIGFDAGLFSNKVGIVIDCYSKKASDLLYNPPVAATAGLGEAPYSNVGSMYNSGIDMGLSYQNKWRDLGFNASLLFTTYKNEIDNISEDVEYFDSGVSRIGALVKNEASHPLSSFYGYQVIGLFKNQGEVDNAPSQDGAAPGFFRFEDINNDDYIDLSDRIYLGDPNPDFTYGINMGLTFNNLDLTVFFYGSKGNDIFNYNKWWTDF